VLFYRHTKAATFIRATLHCYSAFPFVQCTLHLADLMIGSALWNVKQSGLENQQAVQEKLATLACYRDRRKLLAFARDLLNSDYAGHRLTFQLFAQSPPFAQLAAVYRNFDFDGPLGLVKAAAGLSDNITGARS
jgi:hypothetical protein